MPRVRRVVFLGHDQTLLGKAAAMSVAMQNIHHNHPDFRYRFFSCATPENVDDYRSIFRGNPFA